MAKIRKIAPIRYAGSKTRKSSDIWDHFKHVEFETFYDCFLGGGSIPIYVSQIFPNKRIVVNDINPVLINFWRQLQNNSEHLIWNLIECRELHDPNDLEQGRHLFETMKSRLYDANFSDLLRAVAYFVLNKLSFSGLTEHNSFSKSNYKTLFSITNIKKLEFISNTMKNWEIHNIDFKHFMNYTTKSDFIYLDPPYLIETNLYGKNGSLHKTFNHTEFKRSVDNLECPFVISYNDIELLRQQYKHYTIDDLLFSYCMGTKRHDKNELIIKNFSQ